MSHVIHNQGKQKIGCFFITSCELFVNKGILEHLLALMETTDTFCNLSASQ